MIVERPVAAKESPEGSRPIPHPHLAPPPSAGAADGPSSPAVPAHPGEPGRWETRHELARFRAETERVRVLVEFLARPVHAHGGAEPDPDIVTAYNLAVEAALLGVRRAARTAAAG